MLLLAYLYEDGAIDFGDFAVIGKNWDTAGCGSCDGADLTWDGNVTGKDLYEFVGCWRHN